MDEMNNAITAQTNEMRNLLEQIGDTSAKHAAGIIDGAQRIELNGRRLGCLVVIARNEAGELVSEAEVEQIMAEQAEAAALPTQEEINAANIDFLLMMGGEE